jgi:hypothetical protein
VMLMLMSCPRAAIAHPVIHFEQVGHGEMQSEVTRTLGR